MKRKSVIERVNNLTVSNVIAIIIMILPIISYAQPLYKIIRVKHWDSLNIRATPSIKSAVIARIPANGDSIRLMGNEVRADNAVWVKINWQGKQGWVSKYFLQAMPVKQQSVLPTPQKVAKQRAKPVQRTAKSAPKIVDKGIGRNQWILRCGNTRPFWRVDVYPKALKLFTGRYNALLPITYKKQDKNKWNTAKKTHLKGMTANDNVDLTIRYSYLRCNDSISKKKVPFTATVIHNGSEMKGCCMSLKIN